MRLSEFSSIDFRSKKFQDKISNAIKKAELQTSGEIRVHLEMRCKKDPCERAINVFHHLKMNETAARNGILIYIAYRSRKMSIIGDSGIDEKVSKDFWKVILDELRIDFSKQNYADGISKAVLAIGEVLKQYFPYKSDDVNEQSDDISYGKKLSKIPEK
ncbi:MAG: TPM domain-containing protein [Bacteroidales bacterium]